MVEAKCKTCGKVTTGSIDDVLMEFAYQNKKTGNLKTKCKSCLADECREHRRSRKGVIMKIYYKQQKSSKRRNMSQPDYTIDELISWANNQEEFDSLYQAYVDSDYDTKLVPSVDRIDDYKPYTFDNIQLMTWDENNKKGRLDEKNGINRKKCKVVEKYDLDGNFIKEYYSVTFASEQEKLLRESIATACRRGTKLHGFKWKYK